MLPVLRVILADGGPRFRNLLKELIRWDASLSVSEIAEKVGYNSTRYFSKLFETQTGIKPGEYRRLYLRHEKS